MEEEVYIKILILEDDENRINKFRELFIGCDLWITANSDEANKWIGEEEFEYIFLDHDLEDEQYLTWENPDIVYENTGLKTARFLGDNLDLCSTAQIIIHTLNPHGRQNMLESMRGRDITISPFTHLVKNLTVNKT
jgi:hypothetical protein